MKHKTSITLSADLLRTVDQRAKCSKTNRSEFIEKAVNDYIQHIIRQEQDARDLEFLNRRADSLNEEAIDTLAYQVSPRNKGIFK